MPLAFRNNQKVSVGTKIKNLLNMGLSWVNPFTIICLFLVVSALFELFGKDVNIGFYAAFSVFIIGHFCKEIFK